MKTCSFTDIPKTTNGIESYFSHLKNHMDVHRGLTVQHRSTSLNGTFTLTTGNEFL